LADLSQRLESWAQATRNSGETWRFAVHLEPETAENRFGALAHKYSSDSAATTWNSYRTLRIMVTRAQEIMLRHSTDSCHADIGHQMNLLRKIRRDCTDEISASVPFHLHHLPSALPKTHGAVFHTALALIWPLFFAATCALEQVGASLRQMTATTCPLDEMTSLESQASAAAVQASWLIGRLVYISTDIGLKWAGGFVDVLHGDFRVFQTYMLP
jgi:hypothetical protein